MQAAATLRLQALIGLWVGSLQFRDSDSVESLALIQWLHRRDQMRPHERSDLSPWRKRLSDRLELLLADSLKVAHATGALRTRDLKRVTADTTV